MKEDEAKTKWCPMRRMMEVGNFRLHNTEPNAPFTLNCIGSDCMMWQNHIPHPADPHPEQVVGHGYCGLRRK